MDLFSLFRTFLPLHNPIGFGASDFIELALAALLVWFALIWRSWIGIQARKLASRTGWCMLLLALLPIALRLLLLPRYPIPTPNVSDDFSYLLLADTLRHVRLANPAHPLHQFFETFFVLQEPSYCSIFPLGQAMALALGWIVFGHPWAGVALSVGALCALCYWMLRAWTTPPWALAGGLLAVIQFGPLNQWMNSFWGGAVSASAGCLVFGALPRLVGCRRTRHGAILGLGLALQLLTRPFEFVLLVLCVILFFLPALGDRGKYRGYARCAMAVILVMLPAIAIMLLQNKQVTGNWTTLPYMLSRYQYGVPATFTVQSNPIPHRQLTEQQQLDYDVQSSVHGSGTDTVPSYLERFASRLRFYRFFFLAPLYVVLPAFLWRLREFRFAWTILAILIFALGTNFYPYFYSHYIAAVTCLFVLVSVAGLEQLQRLRIRSMPVGRDAARLILFLCAAHFLFWYGLHAVASDQLVAAMVQYETWDAINQGDPEGRIAINHQLAQTPGQQLVFVRYWPPHRFQEWVHNAADIDGSQVVWARDLGAEENEKLRNYYRDRTAWLLEPDFRPPRLRLLENGEKRLPEGGRQ
jgi:hypothetical protein